MTTRRPAKPAPLPVDYDAPAVVAVPAADQPQTIVAPAEEFDPLDDLTIAELEEVEILLGEPIDVALGDNSPRARLMRVLAYANERRKPSNAGLPPKAVWKTVGEMKVRDMAAIAESFQAAQQEADRPTDANG